MILNRHSCRPLVTFAAGLLVLVACQNSTDSNSVSDQPVIATGTFTMGELSRVPDSAAWRSHSDSGIQKPGCDTTFCTEAFHLSHPLGTDSVALELWTLGIRTTTLHFTEAGRSTILDLNTLTFDRDTLKSLLLTRYRALDKASADSLLVLGAGSASLVAYYARLILAGDPDFKGKPKPYGMNVDSLEKALVYWSATEGQTNFQLASLNLLDLDTTSIHAWAIALVLSGTLKPQDTLTFLHPVRMSKSLAVSELLTAGGSSVAVKGAFIWSKGNAVSATISLRSSNGSASNVAYTLEKQPASGDTSWSLDDNMALQAASTADTGSDTLVVTLRCDCGSSTIARTPFRVVRLTPAGDTTAPTIQRVNPIHDTGFQWATRAANLSWTVFDNIQLAQVRLNDSILGSTTALYQNTVLLAVGPNTFVLQASDMRGNTRRDTLHITRLADTTHPAIHRNSHTVDTILLTSQPTDSVSWTVADNALQSVAINGFDVSGNSGTFSRAVPLSGDSTWITLVATDSSGNTTRDSIEVRRLGPSTIIPLGGSLSGGQTAQVAISSNLKDAIIQYSMDRTSWVEYTNAILVSKSQILYSRAMVGGVVSDIDSAIFVYTPNISTPSGAYSTAQTVTIAALGSPSIEDSLSTGTSWNVYSAPLTIDACTKVFARSNLAGKTSDVVEADYAFAPMLSPTIANDTGVDSQVVTVIAPGSDSIQISTDTGTSKTWTTLKTGSHTMMTGTLYARSVVGAAISSISSAAVQLFQMPPTISSSPGVALNTYNISISTSTTGAKIYYTLDGSSPTEQSDFYTAPIQISVPPSLVTVKAISVKGGMIPSTIQTATLVFVVSPPPQPKCPTFTPPPGTYSSPQTVAICCAPDSGSLQYSTGGAMTSYSDPVLISTTTSVTAKTSVTNAGGTSSCTSLVDYTITGQ